MEHDTPPPCRVAKDSDGFGIPLKTGNVLLNPSQSKTLVLQTLVTCMQLSKELLGSFKFKLWHCKHWVYWLSSNIQGALENPNVCTFNLKIKKTL